MAIIICFLQKKKKKRRRASLYRTFHILATRLGKYAQKYKTVCVCVSLRCYARCTITRSNGSKTISGPGQTNGCLFDRIDPDELRSCDISSGPFMNFVVVHSTQMIKFKKKLKLCSISAASFFFVVHREPQHPPWQDILTLSFPSAPGNIRHVCDVHTRTLVQKYLLIIGKHLHHLACRAVRGVEKLM